MIRFPFSPLVRSRLRLVIVAAGLIPLAILARMAGSEKLQEIVQRWGAKTMKEHDRVKTRGN